MNWFGFIRKLTPPVPGIFSFVLFLCFTTKTLAVSVNVSDSSSHGHSLNGTRTTLVRSATPPTKTLINSPLFQPETFGARIGGVIKTLANSIQLPVRESYIAYEQAHPAEENSNDYNFEQYFKPSKFTPASFDTDYFPTPATKLQNQFPTYYPHHHQYPHYYQQPTPLYFPLPPPPPPPPFLRLVKIPGKLQVTVHSTIGGRNDLEIVCEFPPYLLVIQQIYWHVIPPPASPLQPYGIFYDSRNGFAPRVTVSNVSKWKSVLTVRDYSPDDYGTYRCVSTSILPDEPEPTPFPHPPPLPPHRSPLPTYPPTTAYLLHFPHESLELRGSPSTLTEQKNDAKPKSKIGRKIKFLITSGGASSRGKREVGAFGVYAPFFKPYYGIYRVYKEVEFYGGLLESGSNNIENTIGSDRIDQERSTTGSEATGAGNNNLLNDGSGGNEKHLRNEKTFGRRINTSTRRTSKIQF